MSFVDVRFPDKWALDAVRSVRFLTEIVAPKNNRESRNNPQAEARYTWDLSMTAKLADERLEFDAWFLAMGGQLSSFAFRDPADSTMPRQAIGTGAGVQTQFQITKTYAVGAATYARQIRRPVTSSVRVWVAGAEVVSGWTVSRTTGIVEFSAAPTGAVEVACTFDVPVRFNQSSLDWQIAGKNPTRGYLWVCPALALIEVIGE